MAVCVCECTRADDGNGVVPYVQRQHIPSTCSPSMKGSEKETAPYDDCKRVCKRDIRATELNWLGMNGEDEGK